MQHSSLTACIMRASAPLSQNKASFIAYTEALEEFRQVIRQEPEEQLAKLERFPTTSCVIFNSQH